MRELYEQNSWERWFQYVHHLSLETVSQSGIDYEGSKMKFILR